MDIHSSQGLSGLDHLSLIVEIMLNAMPDASLIVDAEGKILFVNNQAEILFGYEHQEFLKLLVEELMPVRFRTKHVTHRHDYLLKPYIRPMGVNLDLYALKKNGTEFSVEISLSPIKLFNKEYVLTTIRDISSRKLCKNCNANTLKV